MRLKIIQKTIEIYNRGETIIEGITKIKGIKSKINLLKTNPIKIDIKINHPINKILPNNKPKKDTIQKIKINQITKITKTIKIIKIIIIKEIIKSKKSNN